MENQRNRELRPDQSEQMRHPKGAPTGFEGMNFEEQRGSLKNSDGAGVSYDHKQSMKQRNGQNGPTK
jgi:hypothetical protein